MLYCASDFTEQLESDQRLDLFLGVSVMCRALDVKQGLMTGLSWTHCTSKTKQKNKLSKTYGQLERLSSHPTSSQRSPPGQPQLHRCKPSQSELAFLDSMQPMTDNISTFYKKQFGLWYWQYWHSRVVRVNLWTRQLSSSDGYLWDKYWAFLKPACSKLVGKQQMKNIEQRWEDGQTAMLTTDSENTQHSERITIGITDKSSSDCVCNPTGFSWEIIAAMLASSS